MEKILGKIMEWSMRVFGYALLLMTVIAFFAMFWKGLYCLGLAYALTEGPNCDGSCTYSTYKAKRYLQAWWDDCADYLEYEKFNFGEVMHNPFDNPEAFMVCMLIEGVGSLLAKCKTIDDAWNDELTLTREVIDKILEEVDEFDVEF